MSLLPTFLQRPSRRIVLAVSLFPMLVLGVCLALFGVDVLYWDEWTIWANVLEAMRNDTLGLAELAAQQNEQRNLAARVVGLALMPLCHLNRFCEYAVMVLMVAGVFLLLWKMWGVTSKRLDTSRGVWLPLGMSALVFSTLQWQLFSFGVNTSIALTVLCLVAGIALLQQGRLESWRVALVLAVGWLGSFNFANGLFYWFCLIPLFFTAPSSRARRFISLAVFLLAGAGAWLLYFHGYVKPPHHPPLGFALASPFAFAGYFFTYLGAPLVVDENLLPLALLMGAGAFVLLAVLSFRLWRQQGLPQMLTPWLILAVFALMSDGATAVGRAGFGMHQALQSRYVTFANLFWCALLAVWGVALARLHGPRLLRFSKGFMTLALGVFLLGSTLSVIVFYNRHGQLLRAKEELFSLVDAEATQRIFPDINYLRKVVPLFFAPRLSVYREVGRLQDYSPLPAPQGLGKMASETSVTMVAPGGETPSGVLLKGRAMDPAIPGQPAAYVCLVSDGRIVFAARPAADGEFEVFLPADWFEAPEVRLMPLAVSADGRSAAFLDMPHNGRLALPEPWYPDFVIGEYFYFPGMEEK